MKTFNCIQIPAGAVINGKDLKNFIAAGQIAVEHGIYDGRPLTATEAQECIEDGDYFVNSRIGGYFEGRFIWIFSRQDNKNVMADCLVTIVLYTDDDGIEEPIL